MAVWERELNHYMKKHIVFLPFLILAILIIIQLLPLRMSADELWENYGSFTPYKTYSYDNAFYAVQKVKKGNGYDFKMIQVCIYEADTNTLLYSFYPARAMDFWGICWESDSYNIWTQSADIGTFCYKYDNRQWTIDKTAVRPPDIVSKYDDM